MFYDSPQNDTILTLSIKSINGIQGNWNVSFPVQVAEVKELACNYTFEKEGFKIYIEKLLLSDSALEIVGKTQGTYNGKDSLKPLTLINGDDEFDCTTSTSLANGKDHQFNAFFPPIDLTKGISFVFGMEPGDSNTIEVRVPIESK